MNSPYPAVNHAHHPIPGAISIRAAVYVIGPLYYRVAIMTKTERGMVFDEREHA